MSATHQGRKLAMLTAVALVMAPGLGMAEADAPRVQFVGDTAPLSAADSGIVTRYRSDVGFPGYEAARALAENLLLFSGSVVAAEPAFNRRGTAVTLRDRSEPTRFFRMDTKTGAFSFSNGLSDYMAPETTPGLPKGDDAVDLALSYLHQLGIAPADCDQLVVQAVGGIGVGVQDEQGNRAQFEKLTSVHFGRRIGGIDVGGPGSKIVVHLGRDGALVGLHHRWSELSNPREISAQALRSPAEVKQMAVKHLKREWVHAERIVAQVPDLGYYDDGKGHIEPAYFVRADVEYDASVHAFAADGEPRRYLGVIPAARFSGADFRQLAPAARTPGTTDEPALKEG